MILNFSIQNFGSIKERQTLSFEAHKSTHLEKAYVVEMGGRRILKLALLYGANASGKTTVLKALDFLRDLVVNPENKKTEELAFEPFLFDAEAPTQSTELSLEFVQNEVRYLYEVAFIKKAIVSETLYFYHPNKAIVYKRKTNLADEFTEITFGSKITVEKSFAKNLEANTLWNNTVLGGYLKTNLDLKELKEASDWFKNYLYSLVYPRTNLEGFVTSQMDRGKIAKADIIMLLKKADFQISDLVMQEEEEKISEGMLAFLKKQMKLPTEQVAAWEERGKLTRVQIALEHTVNGSKYSLPLALESEGTQRYFGLAGLLVLLIKKSIAFPVDELESSLHPDLYQHFLLSFLLNAERSQLIATTHHREILDDKDVFRSDVIWFTDKNENCATELYSLVDFDSTVVRNTTNVLHAYKSGKLQGVPHIGDAYCTLSE